MADAQQGGAPKVRTTTPPLAPRTLAGLGVIGQSVYGEAIQRDWDPTMPISAWPAAERPRDRLLKHGARSLSDAELLAILIRTGVRGRSALGIAQGLLTHFGGLRSLLHAERIDLPPRCGIGPARFAQPPP